ncbi:metal ABC transporter permease [Salibaculum griseiflavum]|uniref:High-affinity zinc uptake system membrane protein ZnuB n=1 Tax=Salibaculum griseiflavum TaxID=1914409 RepID=A0A2V1P0C3_9RHOB|nr:metal ABC transporter permease [Salibaculum griseiflavum]PWG15885.1 hypothetical protein DFK10_14635 [Salibaculum griseiflavum]
MTLLDDFLVRALLAAIGVAVACGALGCFVVWRRMAYFGDATAHAAVLGVALALGFQIHIVAGVLLMAALMALLITELSERGITVDTALGVLSHGALALGLVAVSLIPGVRVDLESYLFGDILLVSRGDLAVIWAGAALVTAALAWRWQALLTATLSPDLARAAGLRPRRERLILTVLLAAVVAVSIKVVGALLITAMLIIPAAVARWWARGPEAMAALATLVGIASAIGGLWMALRFDTPAGPSIVCVAIGFFALASLGGRLQRGWGQ